MGTSAAPDPDATGDEMADLTPMDEKLAEVLGLAQAGDVRDLATWAVGVQRDHVETVRRASLRLAAQEAAG